MKRLDAAWELVEEAREIKNRDPNELRLQRTVATVVRRGSWVSGRGRLRRHLSQSVPYPPLSANTGPALGLTWERIFSMIPS